MVEYIIIHKRHLYYINILFIHFVTHNYHVAVFFLPMLHVYCQVRVERISAQISSSTLCISDTNNSHLATVHHYTEAKERSPMDRLPLHFPPFNTFPFTPASPGRFISVLLVRTTRRKLSSEEGTVLVDAGHFGREYNSKEGWKASSTTVPSIPWTSFWGLSTVHKILSMFFFLTPSFFSNTSFKKKTIT